MASAPLVQPCPACADCSAAKAKLRELQQWRQDADVANAAYGRPPPKVIEAPAGQIIPPKPIEPQILVESPEELAKAGLTPEDLTIPGTNFGAVVYKTGEPPSYTVSFRGTEEWLGSDMGANKDQGLGKFDTPYYSRAQEIGRNMEIKQLRNGVTTPTTKFVGHSLGGGLASAAAVASNGNATTFNAAGLHNNTITAGGRTNGAVTAIRVKGEALTALQESTPLPDAYGQRKVSLDPPFHLGRDVLAQGLGGMLGGLKGIAAAEAVRAGLLHKMGNVTDSLDLALQDARQEVAAKCGSGGGGGSW